MAEERTVSVKRKVIGYLIYFALLFIILMVFLAQVGVFDNNTQENSEIYNQPEQTQTVENSMSEEEMNDVEMIKNAEKNKALSEQIAEKLEEDKTANKSENVGSMKSNTSDKTTSNNASLPLSEPTHFPNKRIN